MATGDLTTLAKVRTHLDLETAFTTDDTMISALVTTCSTWLKNQLGGRDIYSTTYTEYFSGAGECRLWPRQYPITAVSALTIDGDSVAVRATWDADGYVIKDQTSIELVGYTAGYGVNNVTLAYTAGYSTIPEDIDQATVELVAWRYRERKRIGQVSANVGGESVTFSTFAAPQSVNMVIDVYRRWTV